MASSSWFYELLPFWTHEPVFAGSYGYPSELIEDKSISQDVRVWLLECKRHGDLKEQIVQLHTELTDWPSTDAQLPKLLDEKLSDAAISQITLRNRRGIKCKRLPLPLPLCL